MKKNKYLLSITETSRIYGLPKNKLYAAARAGNSEIPFIKIGTFTKINTIMLERLLNEKALKNEQLF
jgi:hypothetical protein